MDAAAVLYWWRGVHHQHLDEWWNGMHTAIPGGTFEPGAFSNLYCARAPLEIGPGQTPFARLKVPVPELGEVPGAYNFL